LAAQGVSREVQGHLQSHGLTGVQARHYDGHDYMREKCRALESYWLSFAPKANRPRQGSSGIPGAGRIGWAATAMTLRVHHRHRIK
jgi:hypothetical protein